MSVHDNVSNLLTQDIPGGCSNLSSSNKELKNLSEYCHKEIFGHGGNPPLEMTKVYAAQSLASVAYQINTLATNLVALLSLQHKQWGEMDHQINDISQQVNFYKEKRSRHLIGKLTSEKPVHLMKRVNPPAQKETVQKYERHPINFTVWDHIGHGSPSQDSAPASQSPVKKPQPPGYRASAVMDRRSLFTQQTTIDQDIYGTSFDVMRYAKKPVAHSIPIAHHIPRTETGTESELTSTSELFVQGHTADSLYDTLSNADPGSGKLRLASGSEAPEPDATLFLPSPQRDMRSPLASPGHPSDPSESDIPPPTESVDLSQSVDDLDDDLYSPEEASSFQPLQEDPLPPPPDPEGDLEELEPVSLPEPEVMKPPRPNLPAPPPPTIAPPPPTITPPTQGVSTSPKISGSRPSRSAPPRPPIGPKLSVPTSAPPRPPPPSDANIPAPPPLPVDPNIPSPPPDLPKPVAADPRIPAPPPNLPKDGLPKAKTNSSSAGPPSSPKKQPPRPAPKGFDPSDIIKMQKSLKKRGEVGGRSADTDTTPQAPTPEKTPSEPRSFLKDTKSTPPSTASLPSPPSAPSAPPSDQTGAAEPSSNSIPAPPPDIPEGWPPKRAVGTSKSAPVAKKTAPPKSQPSLPGFNPSQIIKHRLQATKTPSASSPPADPESPTATTTIPPKYIEIVETVFPYKAQKEDELNFGKGKTIYVLKKNPDEWYEGVLEGVRGLFPANYVKSKPVD